MDLDSDHCGVVERGADNVRPKQDRRTQIVDKSSGERRECLAQQHQPGNKSEYLDGSDDAGPEAD